MNQKQLPVRNCAYSLCVLGGGHSLVFGIVRRLRCGNIGSGNAPGEAVQLRFVSVGVEPSEIQEGGTRFVGAGVRLS